jgi:plasmid stabilization system protein ParE
MSLPLIIRPEAEADLAEARDWYEGQRKGLSDEFRLCVEEAIERIRRMPELHAEIHKGIRRCLIRRFPYAVFCRAEETRVVVIAVMHTRRDPVRWQSRA